MVLDATELPCKPCGRHGHRSCPVGTNACMNQVQPERVVEAIQVLTAGVRRPQTANGISHG